MAETRTAELILQVEMEGVDAEQLDCQTRQLLNELRGLEVESAELVRSGAAPKGAKNPDVYTLGAIAVVAVPSVLPKLVDFVQAWMMRMQGRTVKLKGRVRGQDIEFEGTLEDFRTLLSELHLS